MVVNLVKKKPVDTLVEELRRGKSISKEQVLRESEFADWVSDEKLT